MKISAGQIRFRVDPGDGPPEKAARRLYLTLTQFQACLPRLLGRGFPPPDPDTGMFDLEAVDRWRHRRHRLLFPELFGASGEPDTNLPAKSPGERFREGQEARRSGRSTKV